MMNDEPLSSVPVEHPIPEPENFDMHEWLAGVRPTRRAVRLYARGDLIARMEEVAGRVERLPDGPEADELIAEFDRLKAEYWDGRWFVVEARSPEWVEAFAKAMPDADARTVMLAQTAAQLVTPTMTPAQMLALYESSTGEAAKLIAAVSDANLKVGMSAGVLTLDFSRRRSGTTRRSSEG